MTVFCYICTVIKILHEYKMNVYVKCWNMKLERNEPEVNFLESVSKMKYFTKLNSDSKKDNSFNVILKIASYSELSMTISSLLKVSINALNNKINNEGIDVMLLLEMALQLLPNDEMELLDEIYGNVLGIEKASNGN